MAGDVGMMTWRHVLEEIFVWSRGREGGWQGRRRMMMSGWCIRTSRIMDRGR